MLSGEAAECFPSKNGYSARLVLLMVWAQLASLNAF